jgi:hypothetical protein
MVKQNQKKPKSSPEAASRGKRIAELLGKIEDRFEDHSQKATLSDYVRLTQLERELEDEEPASEVVVRWAEPTEKR